MQLALPRGGSPDGKGSGNWVSRGQLGDWICSELVRDLRPRGALEVRVFWYQGRCQIYPFLLASHLFCHQSRCVQSELYGCALAMPAHEEALLVILGIPKSCLEALHNCESGPS